ncbi:MAG: transcription-repair coupling factor [Alicyclobacillus herbarius]|uniref:transcription-repair coupling factor n=1 Tax=Alicyclobacillus herbarius TaxID=122960 RepID=UPI0023542562|nr:transcription-repair coupling factor [Alicyclobacillus herbarius]MCL6632526.1 transcription-repair coupling factor [Alicyclobacillus herbarius]
MIELVRRLAADDEFRAVAEGLKADGLDRLVSGLGGSARHAYYAALYDFHKREKGYAVPFLIVTHTSTQADAIADDLRELLPNEPVFVVPERELAEMDVMAASPDLVSLRLLALDHLAAGRAGIVVATLASAVQPLTPRQVHQDAALTLQVGDTVDLGDVVERLLAAGYERVDMVEGKGQVSVRGGILDVYPLTAQHPLRIEWFDTDVDSIRTFDVSTQRSLEKLTSVEIGPATDVLLSRSVMQTVAEELEQRLEARLTTVTEVDMRDRLQTHVGADVQRFKAGFPFPRQLRYVQLFQSYVRNLFDYFPRGSILCIDEPSRLQERQKTLIQEWSEWISQALLRGELVSGCLKTPDFDAVWQHPGLTALHFSMFTRAAGGHRFAQSTSVTAKSMQNFHGQMNVLRSEVQRWQHSRTDVVLLAGDEERADRLQRVLSDYRIETVRSDTFIRSDKPVILTASLSAGFELPLAHLAVIVENEVFTKRKKGRRARMQMSNAERIKSYQELKPGDYVVHINHGIGKYLGIRTLEIDGRHKDYLHLQYAGNDSLYVPVEQIDQVQRYIGAEDREPKVYHLGGGEWNRVKQKVSKSVRDIAEDLVKLYAARQATPGHGFSPDTPWQKDFEARFPYEETPDQERAIAEIKRDMEKPRPMDRLLCGDVGYGKTEVAIRAAFKAVMDGKQVAVLVPTTVLAQQHLETFRERFEGFPVTIEVLNRFRTRAETQKVLKGLRDGSIDIVIGTHRLLQKSVKFKDLGLLIVDEEQRFGVTHKERLKQLRTNVDCLTLTATPIPRTLHMSLLGVRDLSVIETPPENRFPVQTYVVEFNEGLIREAIQRELARGGQVYFVYNNVKGIRTMADRVAQLVPEAAIGVAHGQMSEDELERVMLDFLEGELDVLVTTTIIETGLDIPNVNTLIVYDADKLGLAQLYQLRGRVGRSNRIAYAYFTYQRDKVLTEVAEKRLQAIQEFTELGSGFKIAMRDLAIRGAGNLLGAEQHGFINSVGFDLYNDMLAKAIQELKGEKEPEVPEPTIDLSLEAYLPDEFIPDAAQKIAMYKKFRHVQTLTDADDLEEELEDRFGDLPDSVRNLLDITRMKSYAVRYGLESITAASGEATLRLRPDAVTRIDPGKLFLLSKRYSGQFSKRGNGSLQVVLRIKGLSDRDVCARLLEFLRDFADVVKAGEEVEQFAR